MPKTTTEIWSIFGEIEAMVSEQMGFEKIPLWDIPMSARYNKNGEQAKFAVVIPRSMINKFESRVLLLRS